MFLDSVLSEDPLPGLQMSAFLLYPHMAQRESSVFPPLLIRALSLPLYYSTLMTSTKPDYQPKAPGPITIDRTNIIVQLLSHCRIGLQSINLKGMQTSGL